MTDRDDRLGTVEELRRAFDDAFAAPVVEQRRATVQVLLVSVASRRFALPVGDLAGIEAGRRIVPVPGRRRELAGLVAVQGQLVPVHDLGTLLGVESRPGGRRWIALRRDGGDLVGLAFDEFLGVREVAAEALVPLDGAEPGAPVRHVVRVDADTVPVVDPGPVVATVRPGDPPGNARRDS